MRPSVYSNLCASGKDAAVVAARLRNDTPAESRKCTNPLPVGSSSMCRRSSRSSGIDMTVGGSSRSRVTIFRFTTSPMFFTYPCEQLLPVPSATSSGLFSSNIFNIDPQHSFARKCVNCDRCEFKKSLRKRPIHVEASTIQAYWSARASARFPDNGRFRTDKLHQGRSPGIHTSPRGQTA